MFFHLHWPICGVERAVKKCANSFRHTKKKSRPWDPNRRKIDHATICKNRFILPAVLRPLKAHKSSCVPDLARRGHLHSGSRVRKDFRFRSIGRCEPSQRTEFAVGVAYDYLWQAPIASVDAGRIANDLTAAVFIDTTGGPDRPESPGIVCNERMKVEFAIVLLRHGRPWPYDERQNG